MRGGSRPSHKETSQDEVPAIGPRFRVGDKVQAVHLAADGRTCVEPLDVERVNVSEGRVKYTLSANGVMWSDGRQIEDEDVKSWQECSLDNIATQVVSEPLQDGAKPPRPQSEGISFENDWGYE